MFSVESATLWLGMFIAAILIDAIFGRWITHRLPDLSKLLSAFASAVVNRLDRPSRTLSTLKVRGTLVILSLLPLSFACGLLLNHLMQLHFAAQVITVLMLIPLINGYGMISELTNNAIDKAKENHHSNDQHLIARQTAARSILGLPLRIAPSVVAWSLGGFSFLLPYLFLYKVMESAETRRSGFPESPFFQGPQFLYEVLTTPVSFAVSILIGVAHFFVPGTNLGLFTSLILGATIGPVSRYFPLILVTTGLNLSLEAEIGKKTTSRKKSDKNIFWIGPQNGRAKVQSKDLGRLSLVLTVSYALFVLTLLMAFSALILNVMKS